MNMGGFPEEKHKIEHKFGKAAPYLALSPVCSKAVE